MEEVMAFCFKCGGQVSVKDPMRIKWRNKKKRSGHVDCLKGRCPNCQGVVYKIIA